VKYLFVIIGTNIPSLNFVGSVLSIATPLLLFYFLVKYNTGLVESKMRYWHGVQFSIMLFFYASILESLIVFIHVKWIDPAFISNLYGRMIEMAESMEITKALVTQLTEQSVPTPFTYIFNSVIMADVFWGLILSLIIVPVAIRYKPKQNI
jgi:glucose-6-phosphate-specific signal transduction histidine kinase